MKIRMVIVNYAPLLLLVVTHADTIISMIMCTVMNAQLILAQLIEKHSTPRITSAQVKTDVIFQSARETTPHAKESKELMMLSVQLIKS